MARLLELSGQKKYLLILGCLLGAVATVLQFIPAILSYLDLFITTESTTICGKSKQEQSNGNLNSFEENNDRRLDPLSKLLILMLISIYSFSGSGQIATEAIGILFICIL